MRRAGLMTLLVLAGHRLQIVPHPDAVSASVFERGRRIPASPVYWFAWQAFDPHSLVYVPKREYCASHRNDRWCRVNKAGGREGAGPGADPLSARRLPQAAASSLTASFSPVASMTTSTTLRPDRRARRPALALGVLA